MQYERFAPLVLMGNTRSWMAKRIFGRNKSQAKGFALAVCSVVLILFQMVFVPKVEAYPMTWWWPAEEPNYYRLGAWEGYPRPNCEGFPVARGSTALEMYHDGGWAMSSFRVGHTGECVNGFINVTVKLWVHAVIDANHCWGWVEANAWTIMEIVEGGSESVPRSAISSIQGGGSIYSSDDELKKFVRVVLGFGRRVFGVMYRLLKPTEMGSLELLFVRDAQLSICGPKYVFF